MAITSAARSIDLAAYFVPDEQLISQALLAALKRGVRVRIIVPGPHIDSNAARSASRAGWGPLLEAGALVAEYQPTTFHCKILIVDGLMTSVGSPNFDNCSCWLNDEASLNVLDAPFAAEQTAVFQNDLARSNPVSLGAWRSRPLSEKLKDRLAS